MDAHEIQALIRYHCAAIINVIDDDGIKPSQQPTLVKTCERILELANDLVKAAVEEKR